jgi:hypothetical protein
MLKRAALAIAVLLSLAVLPASAAEFREGQIWHYQTRPGEEGSRLFIARIDRGLGTQSIYHIYLDGLHLKNPLYEGGVQNHLPHAAVTRQALETSVTELLESNAKMPDISEGYAEWLLAFEKGQTGVFTIPAKQIVQVFEDAFAKAK